MGGAGLAYSRREVRKLTRTPRKSPAPGETPRVPRAPGVQAAGNRAAANVLARDDWSFSPVSKPSAVIDPATGLATTVVGAGRNLPAPVEDAIRKFLVANKVRIDNRVVEGTISVHEVVNEVRHAVDVAREVAALEIRGIVDAVFGTVAPPETRKKTTPDGVRAELAAVLSNSLPSVPREAAFTVGDLGVVTLRMSGIEISASAGGATVTASADQKGATATAKSGDASASARVEFGGPIAVVGSKGPVALTGRIENGGRQFSLELSIALGTGTHPAPPRAEMDAAIQQTRASVDAVIAHVRGGGALTPAALQPKLAAIGPALEALGAAAVRASGGPAVSVQANVSGGSAGLTAGAVLTVRF